MRLLDIKLCYWDMELFVDSRTQEAPFWRVGEFLEGSVERLQKRSRRRESLHKVMSHLRPLGSLTSKHKANLWWVCVLLASHKVGSVKSRGRCNDVATREQLGPALAEGIGKIGEPQLDLRIQQVRIEPGEVSLERLIIVRR